MKSKIKLPLLLIAAVLLVLAMLRLGVWQLDRADQKREIQAQQELKSERAAVPFLSLSPAKADFEELRYTNVEVSGQYLPQGTIFVDNQVLKGQVGYQVVSPFKVEGMSELVMVNRGWVSVGASREQLPVVDVPVGAVKLVGRLNLPPAQPPYWSEDYPVSQGAVWAYLPIDKYAAQIQQEVLPIVLELAPDQPSDAQLTIQWSGVKQSGVDKHSAYALQWFAMAGAFVLLCLVMLLRRRNNTLD